MNIRIILIWMHYVAEYYLNVSPWNNTILNFRLSLSIDGHYPWYCIINCDRWLQSNPFIGHLIVVIVFEPADYLKLFLSMCNIYFMHVLQCVIIPPVKHSYDELHDTLNKILTLVVDQRARRGTNSLNKYG